MATSAQSIQWPVPAALTHATWQAAHADCQALLSQTDSLTLDWQACKQVDSSALALMLDLKRGVGKTIAHAHAPAQLVQLAKLYEVDGVLGLH
jgi:ABC-type transporter Mla MlaB component